MAVREANPGDVLGVLNVLDAAALEIEYDRVRAGVEEGAVFVAVPDDEPDGIALGALVLDGDHVEAIAVRPNRRGQGIGTALVEEAASRRERLTATFDAAVRPFYEQLGFAIERSVDEGRCRGVWTAE